MWRSEDQTHSVGENARHYLNHVSSERTSFNLVKSHIRPSRFSCDWKFVLWIISTPGLFQWFPAQHLAQSHPNMARGIMAEGRHHSESCHHSVYSQHQTSTSITLYKAWLQNITLYKADMWPSVAWSPACNEHHHLDLNSDLAAAARHRTFTIIERDEFLPPTSMFFVMLFCFFLFFFCKKKLEWALPLWFEIVFGSGKALHVHNHRTWWVLSFDQPYSLSLLFVKKRGENSIITTINLCGEDLITPILVFGHSFVFVGLCDGKLVTCNMLVLGEVIDWGGEGRPPEIMIPCFISSICFTSLAVPLQLPALDCLELEALPKTWFSDLFGN